MTKDQILIGYRVGSGEPVHMSPKHTMITGMTGDAGKTTCIEGIASRWEGQKFVVFLAKPGEEAFRQGRRIKPFFKQKAGWQYVEDLIEASQQERIKIIRATLIKICERTKTLEEVFSNANERIAEFDRKNKTGFEYDMLIQVREYLRQVLNELKEHDLASELDLKDGINVVDLTEFSPVMQAMVVGAIAEEILRNHTHTSIVIPEAWQTIPGDRGSPATSSVEALIRQGRVRHNFVLIDSQDIAGVNTKIRRHIGNYLLGKQGDEHEIERTLKAIALPAKSKPKADEVQTLKKGQFFAVIDEQVVKVYARPAWLPEENAIKIAQHPEDVALISGPRGSQAYVMESARPAGAKRTESDVLDELENETIKDLQKRLQDAKDQIKAQGEMLSAANAEKLRMTAIIQELTERLGKQELELEDARKLREALFAFAWPSIKAAMQGLIKNLRTGAALPGSAEIPVQLTNGDMPPLSEETTEGKIYLLILWGKIKDGMNFADIHKALLAKWHINTSRSFASEGIKPAVQILMRRPYELIDVPGMAQRHYKVKLTDKAVKLADEYQKAQEGPEK